MRKLIFDWEKMSFSYDRNISNYFFTTIWKNEGTILFSPFSVGNDLIFVAKSFIPERYKSVDIKYWEDIEKLFEPKFNGFSWVFKNTLNIKELNFDYSSCSKER